MQISNALTRLVFFFGYLCNMSLPRENPVNTPGDGFTVNGRASQATAVYSSPRCCDSIKSHINSLSSPSSSLQVGTGSLCLCHRRVGVDHDAADATGTHRELRPHYDEYARSSIAFLPVPLPYPSCSSALSFLFLCPKIFPTIIRFRLAEI